MRLTKFYTSSYKLLIISRESHFLVMGFTNENSVHFAVFFIIFFVILCCHVNCQFNHCFRTHFKLNLLIIIKIK